MINIRKLEADLWESADLLRAGSKLTSNQYCMPVLGLLFLRYAYSRYKLVEAEILASRPMRNGRVMPVEAGDFKAKSALYLPREAQYPYLVELPSGVAAAGLRDAAGNPLNTLGEVVNNAMNLVEAQSGQLHGVLPKDYSMFSDALLGELLRIFNNNALDDIGGDVFGRIYEYFLNKFARNIASDDGVFFTPKSLVKMIVNVLEPRSGILLDPACGSGGMFVQTGDFVNRAGMIANNAMTFYAQEKVEYNAKLCLMNMAVHGLSGVIKSGDEANTFYHDAHNLAGECDYVMANPPFNVDKVKAEDAENAGRLPFGLPSVNKQKEVGNGNYLWISYFYAYLNERGRAGFVMASSATDSQGKDKEIREKLVRTGHVDVMVSVGNNFFYTKSLPCSLWFFDKAKAENNRDRVLFIDARNYYTVVDRTLNEWSPWQLKNLNAIVWLYRGEAEKYKALLVEYREAIAQEAKSFLDHLIQFLLYVPDPDLRERFERQMKNKCLQDGKPDRYEDMREYYISLESELKKICGEQLKRYLSWPAKAKKAVLEKLKLGPSIHEYKKTVQVFTDTVLGNASQPDSVQYRVETIRQYLWLIDKFGDDGVYADIPGVCKIATLAEIEEKNWSLTPGAYVGVAEAEDDGVDFAERMREIHAELLTLQEESNALMKKISANFKELGI